MVYDHLFLLRFEFLLVSVQIPDKDAKVLSQRVQPDWPLQQKFLSSCKLTGRRGQCVVERARLLTLFLNNFFRLSFSSHPIVEKERILRINLFLSWSIFEALHQGDSSSSLSHLIDVYAVLVCHSTGGGWHLLPLHEDRGTSCLPSKALGKSQTFQVV